MKTTSTATLAAALLAAALPTARTGAYTLHEWGTFTAVIGSDGTHLDGVHREDAPLPDFVYELDDPHGNAPRMTKGINLRRSFAGVNVRLETPVLYFYTDEAFDARVEVGYKGGTIGQWFPDRSAGEKRQPPGPLDFRERRDGSIRWDVRVEPAGEDADARVFRPGELPCWIYPRLPDSALVTNAKGETEKYLFYRGLGRMDLPLVFTATDESLRATNRGPDPITGWLVFENNGHGRARWWTPDSIAADGGAVDLAFDGDFRTGWQGELYADGLDMLIAAGLNRKEADSMLQTWWSSYFGTAGMRVFWVVPRALVDEVLPLEVSPAPSAVERVIVGRSEILRPSFERRLLADFEPANGAGSRWKNDRFFHCYQQRVTQLKKGAPPASAESAAAAPPATWDDRISSAILAPNVRVLAFEEPDFQGAKIELNGSAVGGAGGYPMLLDMQQGLAGADTWNDRISSLRVLDGRGGSEAPDDADKARLFEDSRFGARVLEFGIGAEIRDLSAFRPGVVGAVSDTE